MAIGSLLVNFKNILTNFDIDSEYAVAMAYRLTQGDVMFSQMREPHQTSAFLSAVFVHLFMRITDSTTGIVIYLNAVGVVLKGIVTGVIYHTFKRDIDIKTLCCMCVYFFTVNPKNITLPEFSNMQIWFATLLLCSLYRYWKNQKNVRFLFLAGFFLCLEILSYPSCLIIYALSLCILWKISEKKIRDILLLTMECGIIGAGYLLWFGFKIGFWELWNGIIEVIRGDASHGSILPAYKIKSFFTEGRYILLEMIFFTVIAGIFTGIFFYADKAREKKRKVCDTWLFIFCILYLVQNFLNVVLIPHSYSHYAIYFPILILACYCKKICNVEEKVIFYMGTAIGLGNFLATSILTNLGLYTIIAYGILMVIVCFIPISKNLTGKKGLWLLLAFCFVSIFRQGLVFKSVTFNNMSISNIGGIVKTGPARGIVTDYMAAHIENESIDEWKSIVQPGDRVLIVGEYSINALGYLYQNTIISADSTICTPTFNEKLVRYWEKNPERYPNVVAVDCWYGELKINEDNWILQWLENEYHADKVIDGTYWRYYIKLN